MAEISKRLRGRGAIALVLLLCLALRIGLALYHGEGEVRGDAAVYKLIAENIADGKGFISDSGGGITSKPHPSAHGYVLYPYFLAGLMWSINAGLFEISIVQSVIDTLTCLLVFLLMLRVTTKQNAALGAALIYAIYPPFIMSACSMMTETTTTFVLMSAAYLLYLAFKRGAWFFALAGAVMGITILAKPAMLAFPFVVALLLILSKARGWLSKALIYVAAAYLVVSPWTIRNYFVFRAFVPVTTNLGMVLWQGTGPYDGICPGGPGYPVDTKSRHIYNNPMIPYVSEQTFQKVQKLQDSISNVDEVRRDEILRQAAIKEIREHPGRWLMLAVKKPVRLWLNVWTDHPPSMGSIGLAVVTLALIILALLGCRQKRVDWYFKTIAVSMCAYITVLAIVTYAGMRYSYPYMPFVIMLAAAGLGKTREIDA